MNEMLVDGALGAVSVEGNVIDRVEHAPAIGDVVSELL